MNKLPLYQCHRIVAAAKILSIIATAELAGASLILEGMGNEGVQVDTDWLTRNPKAAEGGYYVVYVENEDKYSAYSPAEPFEQGYALLGDGASAASALNISALEELVKLHTSDGYWNFAPTDFGIANGLICALFTLKGEEPEFLEAPATWLSQQAAAEQMGTTAPTSNLPPYQQRVIDECEQLDKRLGKLKEFFLTELFAGLSHDKQHLMQCQANHMANYSQILHARIAEF